MQLEKLRAKGIIGFKRGLGLDEIAVDFTKVNGLVALEGPNGSGKSSLLELLHPYNQLASRDGALYRHVFMRDAEKELSFSYAGHHYRTLLKIDGQSGKSEGYIWADGKSVVNGKVSAYAAYIRELFGTPELFFNSVFCAQNSKKLSEMTTGQMKELFSEFLRLDRLVAYEGTAKQCVNIVNGKIASVDARIASLSEKTRDREAVTGGIALAEGALQNATTNKSKVAETITELRNHIDVLNGQAAKNTVLLDRRAAIISRITELSVELDKEKNRTEANIEGLKAKYRELNAEMAKCDAIIADKDAITNAADREREANDRITALSPEVERLTDEIAQKQATAHKSEQVILNLKQTIKDIDKDDVLRLLTDALTDMTRRVAAEIRALQDIDADRTLIDLKHKLDVHKDKIKGLDCRDPRCPDECNTCLYITDALASREALPAVLIEIQGRTETLEKSKAEIRENIAALEAGLALTKQDHAVRAAEVGEMKAHACAALETNERALKADKIILSQFSDTLSTIRQSIAEARFAVTKSKDMAARQGELQVAISRKADLNGRLAEITEAGQSATAAWNKWEHDRRNQIAESQRKVDELDTEIDHEVATKLNNTIAHLAAAEKLIPGYDKEILEIRESLSRLHGDLARIMEAEKDIEAVRSERDLLVRDASEWTYLRNACSKTGLQALEIDGAAPIITGYANDLLSKAFGPLYSVKFRTQDDDGREILDIVTISDDGEEVLLDNLSGGQRIWILMALRLAMTLLSKEKSGRAFMTGFADEMDGSLDPDNALNFVHLYRSFMQAGRFGSFLFISHRPSCRAMADHVLKIEPGKNPYWG